MAGRGGQSGGRQGAGASAKTSSRPAARRTSPAVYRRRRIVVGGFLLLILVLMGGAAWALVRGGGHSSEPARSGEDAGPIASSTASQPADAAAAPTASTTPTPTAPATPTCDPAKIDVTAATDKPVYAPTENPVLTLKVTNKNAIPCPVNVGTSQMEYLILSGADRIFDSKDCQQGAADLTKTIAPGASETANFPWPRIRSTEGCKAVTVKPLPGTYVLTTSLGSIQSPKAVFTLQ